MLALSLHAWYATSQCGPDGNMPIPPGETECPDGPPPEGGPGGGGGGGPGMGNMPGVSGISSSSSTECSKSGSCSSTGNEYEARLSYDGSTGIFSGILITNLCPAHNPDAGGNTASCTQQTFPDEAFLQTPTAAPLLGRVALTISGGVNVYGPFEAGFTTGQACSNGLGDCDGGIDIGTCDKELVAECGAEAAGWNSQNTDMYMLMDSCGGHANPYHFHTDLVCEYNVEAQGHSTLAAVALDGRGIYGRYETTGTLPGDLDACNGHLGPVPALSSADMTVQASSSVYHYHTSTEPPYTVGCYGPVESLDACKALYDTCSDGMTSVAQPDGAIDYDAWCPCFQHEVSSAEGYGFTPAEVTVMETEEVKAIMVLVTLSGLASPADFTEVLQAAYIENIADAAGVPDRQVVIIGTMPGSVVVRTAIVIPADASASVEQKVKENLTSSPEVVDAERFGEASVTISAVETFDSVEDVKEEMSGVTSVADHRPTASVALAGVAMAAVLLARRVAPL